MRYFCTYFDQRYLPRGLALYESLRQHCPAFKLWVLCLDHVCYDVLVQLNLANIELIPIERLEAGDEELLQAKQNRSTVEYYFTLTPSLLLFILRTEAEVDLVTYLDADLWFCSDLAPVYEEIGDHSIAIIGHRFPPSLQYMEQNGIYNVGWLSFRRDENGLACLEWWREKCIEWCYDRCEEGRFADQKYLDSWPTLFSNVVVLKHKGANLAPWNLARYSIRFDGESFRVDEQPLIFFHFHGLKHIWRGIYDPGWWMYDLIPTRMVWDHLYRPYISALRNFTQQSVPFLGENKTAEQLSSPRFPISGRIVDKSKWFLKYVARQVWPT